MKEGEKLLKALGLEPLGGSLWIRSHCPLAPWKHQGGTDSNPSFGVNEEKRSFNCFACSSSGSWEELVEFLEKKGIDVKEAKKIIKQELIRKEFAEYENRKSAINCKSTKVYPDNYMERFQEINKNSMFYEYLKFRNVPFDVAKEWGVKADTYRMKIVFPIYNRFGNLIGVIGRTLRDGYTRYYFYSYQGTYNHNMWLGLHRVNFFKPLVVVEGVFDLLAVYPVYKNVVAGLTSKQSSGKISLIKDAIKIVSLLDNDKGGEFGRKALTNYFRNKIKHLIPKTDPGDMTQEELRKLLKV